MSERCCCIFCCRGGPRAPTSKEKSQSWYSWAATASPPTKALQTDVLVCMAGSLMHVVNLKAQRAVLGTRSLAER